MRNKSNKGFTLIELLIVIAIIGILSAVLIPNLLNARRSAQATASDAYAKNVITWIAAADSSARTAADKTALVTQVGGSDCLTPTQLLQDEGAPAAAPSSVSSCAIAYDATTSQWEVTTVSTADPAAAAVGDLGFSQLTY